MHTSVLPNETITGLDLQAGELVFDGTFGLGGHSRKILESNPSVKVLATDLDSDSQIYADTLKQEFGDRFTFVQNSFMNITEVLTQQNLTTIDKALLDLGWNSNQFEAGGRGFSFQKDEPLLMSFKKEINEDDVTAFEIVNKWEEENIADILYGFGEERYSRHIARAIVVARQEKPIETTGQLVEVIYSAVPKQYRFGKIHPATRTFQALRITVNKELQVLEIALREIWQHLRAGGKMAIISFHSLEDRIVKNFAKEREKQDGKNLTKKPITPSEIEIQANPRARSAKMRIIQKLNQN